MNEEILTSCFQLITFVGTARSCFINAIQCAKAGKYEEAADMLKQGDEAFVLGHHVHSDLAEKETNGEMEKVGLLLLHAEDQLMSAEGFRTIAEEFIAVYKRMDSAASALSAHAAEPAAQEDASVPAPDAVSIEVAETEAGVKQFKYVIQDALGIHARPAGQLVKVAKELDSTITIEKVGGKSAVATKLMALMGLGIKGGDTIIVTVEGGDVDANVQAVKKFLTENL